MFHGAQTGRSITVLFCSVQLNDANRQFINKIMNQHNGMCVQRRLRSALVSAKSDQSRHYSQWVAKDPSCLHTDSKDCSVDQTGWMSRLISVFAGRTCHFVGFVMLWLINHLIQLLIVLCKKS